MEYQNVIIPWYRGVIISRANRPLNGASSRVNARRIQKGVARFAKESAKGNTMQNWEQLSSVCDTMSGQAHGRGEPNYVTSMNNRFEELADAMIEAF